MARVMIPALLRDLCGGVAQLEVSGTTLAELFGELDLRCPGFKVRVIDNGRIRPELAIAINGDMEPYALHDPVPPGAEVAIIPAIGGGAG